MNKIIFPVIVSFLLVTSLVNKSYAQELRGYEIWFERITDTEYDFYFDIYLYSETPIDKPFLKLDCTGPVKDTAYLQSQVELDDDISLLSYKASHKVPDINIIFYITVEDFFSLPPNIVNYQSNRDTFFIFKDFFIINPTFSQISNSPYFSINQTTTSIQQGTWLHAPQAEDPEGDLIAYELFDFNVWSNNYWSIDYDFPADSSHFFIDSMSGVLTWDQINAPGFYLIGIKVIESINPTGNYLSEIYRIMFVEIKEEDIITATVDLDEKSKFDFFPNPTADNITINLQGNLTKEKSTLTLTNLLGQSLQRIQLPHFDGVFTYDLEV
ncbi:MAG: hypothetical protein AAF573_11065, partial [Bacteroidota bacterium]